MKEHIICAAVKFDNGQTYMNHEQYGTGFVIAGFEHVNIKSVASILSLRESIPRIEGFLTSKDRFVDRKDAAKIAHESGQVDELHDELFSYLIKY